MICQHLYKTFALTALLLSAAYQTPLPAQVKPTQTTGYGKASYDASHAGKFMKNWLVAGPIDVGSGSTKPTDALQEKAFREDLVSKVPVSEGQVLSSLRVKESEMPWRMVSSPADIVDLDSFYKKKDFAYAYLLAELRAAEPTNTVLAVGSDDAIKIWLNGKLVHENLVGREVRKDDDQVALRLEKGSNQLLIKVQDEQGGWALVARVLDKAALSAQLSIAAGNGNLDKIKFLIDAGADVNAKNEAGITPMIAARLGGRDEGVELLLKEGAKDEPVPPAETLVENMYKQLNGKSVPGIAVLVAKEGTILLEKGFGYADIKNKIPVNMFLAESPHPFYDMIIIWALGYPGS